MGAEVTYTLTVAVSSTKEIEVHAVTLTEAVREAEEMGYLVISGVKRDGS